MQYSLVGMKILAGSTSWLISVTSSYIVQYMCYVATSFHLVVAAWPWLEYIAIATKMVY